MTVKNKPISKKEVYKPIDLPREYKYVKKKKIEQVQNIFLQVEGLSPEAIENDEYLSQKINEIIDYINKNEIQKGK